MPHMPDLGTDTLRHSDPVTGIPERTNRRNWRCADKIPNHAPVVLEPTRTENNGLTRQDITQLTIPLHHTSDHFTVFNY